MYQEYLDLDTGRMLIAAPGDDYAMTPVDPPRPVPPADGRWEPATQLPPPVVFTPLPAPAPAAPASSGGES